jgi:hypothetical protein
MIARVDQPLPPDPAWPRHSSIPFPPSRFVPGRLPHPRRDPRGHSFGLPEPKLPPWSPLEWGRNLPYLFGIDLYNFAYWWECHEALEALWHAAGRRSVHAQFLQGIIQVAAGNLKRFMGKIEPGRRLIEEGLGRLEGPLREGPVYMGVRLPEYIEKVSRDHFALIRLEGLERFIRI